MPNLPNNSQKSNSKLKNDPPYTNRGGYFRTRLDFLSFSYCFDALEEDADKEKSARDLLKSLGFSMYRKRTGYQGFKQSAYIHALHERNVGLVAWGGNQNRVFVSLTGKAFDEIYSENYTPPTLEKKIPAIPPAIRVLREFFEEATLKGKFSITRCDIALDDFSGKFDLQFADLSHEEGLMSFKGDVTHSKYLSNEGSTHYYGSRKSGKMLRVYEKGRQMKSEEFADWVRWEVELRGKDRNIPETIITETDEHFAGAYPVCSTILEQMQGEGVQAQQIKTINRVKSQISKEVMSKNIKHQYGKHIANLLRQGVPIEDFTRSDYVHEEGENEIIVLRLNSRKLEELFRVDEKVYRVRS